jgi:hypothetical protein
MDNVTTKKLLILTCRNKSNSFLRLYDAVHDKDEVAELTERLFDIIRGSFEWRWPDSGLHLSRRQFPDDSEARQRQPKEDDDHYRERLHLVETAPQRQTQEQADWIRYATILTNTLVFLSDQSDLGSTMGGSHEGYPYSFNQRKLYHCMWMCFYQGLGPEAWRIRPEQPPESLEDPELTHWYKREAEKILERVKTRWEDGTDLDAQFPEHTSLSLFIMANSRDLFGL